MPYLFAVLLWPFVHLGVTYYVSIASLTAALFAVPFGPDFIRSFRHYWPLIAAIFVTMLFCLLMYSRSDMVDLSRTLREATVFSLMILYRPTVRKTYGKFSESRILKLLMAVSFGMLVLVVIQFFMLRNGIYFGIPKEFFVRNSNTIPGILNLIYSKIRPAGTFGEPSYLSFIMLSFMTMVASVAWRNGTGMLIFLVSFLTIIISQSSYGLMFALTLTSLVVLKYSKIDKFILTAILAVLFTVSVLATPIFDRVLNSGDVVNELSGFARLFAPLVVLPQHLLDFPFGVPYNKLDMFAHPYGLPVKWSEIVHNGIFNIITDYGIVGIFMLVILFLRHRTQPILLLYVALLMVQNGDPLGLDKFAVYMGVLSTSSLFSQNRSNRL